MPCSFCPLQKSTTIPANSHCHSNPESILTKYYYALTVQATLQKKCILNIPGYGETLFKLLSIQIQAIEQSALKLLKKIELLFLEVLFKHVLYYLIICCIINL